VFGFLRRAKSDELAGNQRGGGWSVAKGEFARVTHLLALPPTLSLPLKSGGHTVKAIPEGIGLMSDLGYATVILPTSILFCLLNVVMR